MYVVMCIYTHIRVYIYICIIYKHIYIYIYTYISYNIVQGGGSDEGAAGAPERSRPRRGREHK